MGDPENKPVLQQLKVRSSPLQAQEVTVNGVVHLDNAENVSRSKDCRPPPTSTREFGTDRAAVLLEGVQGRFSEPTNCTLGTARQLTLR